MVEENKSARNHILTINPAALEYYTDIIDYLKGLSGLNYLLVTEHFGQAQKHYHVYVQYKHSKLLSYRRLHGAHAEPCYGSAQANIKYCMAEDEKHVREGVTAVKIEEWGEATTKGGNFTVGYLRNLSDDEELPAIYYNTYKKIQNENSIMRVRDFRKNVKVYWIQGPSGVGKTNKAFEIAEEFENQNDCGTDMVKFVNGFYLGTTPNAKIAIYDDFRDSHMHASEFINFIDYNKHWMNIKGSSILNNYLCIIITSVQKLERIYSKLDDEPRKQWERRIEKINMYPPEPVSIGGFPIGYRTEFNQLEEYEVTDDWDGSRVIIE